MFSVDENDEASAIGWISISDLLMVGLMGVLLTVVVGSAAKKTAEERARKAEVALEAEREAHRKKLADAEEAIRQHTQQKNLLDEQTEMLRQKENQLKAALAALDAARQDSAMAAKIREEYDKLLVKLRQAEDQLAKEQQRINEKQKQLQEALASLDATRRDLLAAQKQLTDMQTKLAEANRSQLDYEKKLAETERRLLELQKYVADLNIPSQQQIASWKQMEKDYAAQKEKNAKLMAELEEARKESTRLHNVVADLETELKKHRDDQITAEVREQVFRQELLGIRTRDSGYGRVVFVVDCSGSMVRSSNTSDESRWDYVQTVIRNWLLLLPFQEVQLVMFNNEVDVYPRPGDFVSLQKTAASRRVDIQPLLTALKDTVPNQGTNTALALQTAYQADNVDAIFLFTDGQPMLKAEVETTSEDFRILQNEVLELIVREKQRGNAPPINVIGLGDYFSNRLSGPDQKHLPFGVFLTRIAQLSGGTFLGR